MTRLLSLGIVLLLSRSTFALKNSKYQRLLEPLDLYENTVEAGKLLSLNVLTEKVVNQNLSVKSAEIDTKIAKENYHLIYDNYSIPRTVIGATATQSQSYSAAIRSFNRKLNLGLGLTGQTEWGFSYSLDLPRVGINYSSVDSVDGESDSLTVGFSASLSLLRGSVFFVGRNLKTQADLDWEIAKLNLKNSFIQNLLLAELAYLDLVSRTMRLKVAERGLSSAEAFFADVTEMIRLGEQERLASVKAEQLLAQAESELLSARVDRETAERTLKEILAWDVSSQLVPDVAKLKLIPSVQGTSDEIIKKALMERPDILIAKRGIEKADLELQYNYSRTLPQLDLKGGFGYSGSGSSITEAQRNLTQFSSPIYSIGLELSYSLFNDSDKTDYRTTILKRQRSEFAYEKTRRMCEREIAVAFDTVQTATKRLNFSERARLLSEKKLQAEFEKFRLGESNIRNVIDFQTEVNQTRLSELSVRIDLIKAISTLRAVSAQSAEGFVK